MGQLDSHNTSNELQLIGVPEKLARVCCRARKIPQQPCDGTCGDCKKNFNAYIQVTTKTIQSGGQLTGSGPDEEPPMTPEEARNIVTQRIKDWINRKRDIISNLHSQRRIQRIKDNVSHLAAELH